MANYRRHHPRVAGPRVSVFLPFKGEMVEDPVHDLSGGGVLVTPRSTLPVGSELDLRIEEVDLDKPKEPILLKGRVARLQVGASDDVVEMAIQFIERVESSSARLFELVERHEQSAATRAGPPSDSASQEAPRWRIDSPSRMGPFAGSVAGSARNEPQRLVDSEPSRDAQARGSGLVEQAQITGASDGSGTPEPETGA